MIHAKSARLLALFTLAMSAPAACSEERPVNVAGTTVGAVAPDFQLLTYGGGEVSLGDHEGEIVVLEWFAHNCEFTGSHYKKGAGTNQKAGPPRAGSGSQ